MVVTLLRSKFASKPFSVWCQEALPTVLYLLLKSFVACRIILFNFFILAASVGASAIVLFFKNSVLLSTNLFIATCCAVAWFSINTAVMVIILITKVRGVDCGFIVDSY